MKLTLPKGQIPAHLLKYFKSIAPKPKDDLMIPHRVYQALMEDGWYGRSDVVWHKPNCMPESVTDRPTRAHEYIFLLTKSARYFYDAAAVAERAEQPAGVAKLTGQIKRGELQDLASSRLGTNQGGGTRNRRSVWTTPTQPYKESHFAVMPEALVEPCILAGSRPGDVVLDPFAGSGTTLRVAERLGRDSIGIDLNPQYIEMQERRTNGIQRVMTEVWE